MAVDSYVLLPGNVRLVTLTNVLGKLCGGPCVWNTSAGYRWVDVSGASYRGSDGTPEMAVIDIHKKSNVCELCGTEHSTDTMRMLYYFENNRGGDCWRRCLNLGRSTAERIAIGKGVVDFFGGILVLDDTKLPTIGNTYIVDDKNDKENAASGGKEWDALQQRIADVQAVTQKEIDACEGFAAYKKNSHQN